MLDTGRDTEFRTFCLVCLGSGVLLRLRFIKCVFLGACNISTRCGWYVSQKCSSLPVLAAKSERSEFGVPPSVDAMSVLLQI